MLKEPVIIDTDPGIDDFMALVLAAKCERFDIKALTPVAGNQVFEKYGAMRGGLQNCWELTAL